MNRTERATPTVLSVAPLAEAWAAPPDFTGARETILHRAKAQISIQIADGITAVGVTVSPSATIGVLASPRAKPHVDADLPEWSALWVLQAYGHHLGIADHVPTFPQRDHATPPPIARPCQRAAPGRQRCAVQRAPYALDGFSCRPATALDVRRELRFLRKTRPAGGGGENPCRGRRRGGPGSFVSTRRSPGQTATEALSARLNPQRRIDTESHDPEKNSASSERGAWRVA